MHNNIFIYEEVPRITRNNKEWPGTEGITKEKPGIVEKAKEWLGMVGIGWELLEIVGITK